MPEHDTPDESVLTEERITDASEVLCALRAKFIENDEDEKAADIEAAVERADEFLEVPDQEDLLIAIAQVGERRHVLRQLAAVNQCMTMDAVWLYEDKGLNPNLSTAREIAEEFVPAYNSWIHDGPGNPPGWEKDAEKKYGDRADEIMEMVDQDQD
jgi:hypothetical protein